MNSSFTHPDDSLDTFMDAVDRVTNASHPAFRYTYSRPTLTSLLPRAGGIMDLNPAQSHLSRTGGMMAHHSIQPCYPTSMCCGMIACRCGQTLPMDADGTLASQGGPLGKRNYESMLASGDYFAAARTTNAWTGEHENEQEDEEETRAQRLAQNRLAAVESRRRKKKMVDELHRSVQYYSMANSDLKIKNAELERQLLTAKEKVLLNNEKKAKSKGSEENSTSSTVKSDPLKEDEKAIASPTEPEAKLSKQADLGHDNRAISASSAFTSNAEMAKQAQQAQFAANQALYRSMGYPAVAARAAASTLFQCEDQDLKDSERVPPKRKSKSSKGKQRKAAASAPAASVPQAKPSSHLALFDEKLLPQPGTDSNAYIEALNRFAMQQAAAASAAAAAANAAMEAIRLRTNLGKSDFFSSSMTQAMSSLPYSYPTIGQDLPYQNNDRGIFFSREDWMAQPETSEFRD